MERLLGGQVGVVVVGRMQGHGPPHGLQVVAPAAGGATVDDQLRVPLAQGVPIGQVALHVQVLASSPGGPARSFRLQKSSGSMLKSWR